MEIPITITSKVFGDSRGYFFESFSNLKFANETKKNIQFVQDNESSSIKNVARGLHYQKGDFAQAKLVRVIKGGVLDFALNIETGDLYYEILTEENKKQFFVPRGYAHGFIVLPMAQQTIFAYKCDNYYNKESEGGFNFYSFIEDNEKVQDIIQQAFNECNKNDKINFWIQNLIFSEKDKFHPDFPLEIKYH